MKHPQRAHQGRVLILRASHASTSHAQVPSARERRMLSVGSDHVIKVWKVTVPMKSNQVQLEALFSVRTTMSCTCCY